MKYLLFFIMFSLFSCSKENPSPFNQFEIDASLRIYLEDNDGVNLLNSSNYQSENFRIFKDVNGQPVEIYNPQLDNPRNFLIDTQTDPISMILFMDFNRGQLTSKTYIQWNEFDTDTIKSFYIQTDKYAKCSTVWLNGSVVWNLSTPEANIREITVVK